MPTPFTTTLELDSETGERLQRLAAESGRSPDSILREAIGQYLESKEKGKNYLRRNPVGGIITPM